MSDEYDVVIIGAGVAGLTAAMYTGRYGLSTLVMDPMGAGGQVVNEPKIENFPGFPEGIDGIALGEKLLKQATDAGAELRLDLFKKLEVVGPRRIVHGFEGEVSAHAVILASGSSLRTLGIRGEQHFLGRGVSRCATCDGMFFKDEPVCVVGGGDSALDEAVILTEHASSVDVYVADSELAAHAAVRRQAERRPGLRLSYNTAVTEIIGDDRVSSVRLMDTRTGEERLVAMAGVFVYAGLVPNTFPLRLQVELDPRGHIVTNAMMQASLAGVFAAGDIRQHSVAQLAAAAGDGVTAAIAAYRYISGMPLPKRPRKSKPRPLVEGVEDRRVEASQTPPANNTPIYGTAGVTRS